jgi:hypothetical protein
MEAFFTSIGVGIRPASGLGAIEEGCHHSLIGLTDSDETVDNDWVIMGGMAV